MSQAAIHVRTGFSMPARRRKGTVSRGRTAGRVTGVELPAEQAKRILRAFPKEVPGGVGFYKRAGLVEDGTPDEFESFAGRCAVFRLDQVSSP